MQAHPIVRLTLWTGLTSALASVGACKGPPHLVPPIECPDPCCGGNGQVDCEQTPNVSCTEDADICTARNYGCSNGSEYSGVVPANRPLSCSADAGFGDVVSFDLPDGFGSLVQSFAADGSSSSEGSAQDGGTLDAAP
jgi:hypothetical protein